MKIPLSQLGEIASSLGIDRVGVASLDIPVESSYIHKYDNWIAEGHHADMTYLETHRELRKNPKTLLPEAQSIIVCAISYFPKVRQAISAPQISKYAYGRDYHKVVKKALTALADHLTSTYGQHTFRVCVDTAPISERYWAQRVGIGYAGKNQNIIVPGVGSYVFLGEILTTLAIEESVPIYKTCGRCNKCIEACPTQALSSEGLDARRCLSYLTIEHKGDIPLDIQPLLGSRIYGCDTCQDVCPHNRSPLTTRLFKSSPKIIELKDDDLKEFTEEKYGSLFFGSAATRAKYEGMKRNIDLYFKNKAKK